MNQEIETLNPEDMIEDTVSLGPIQETRELCALCHSHEIARFSICRDCADDLAA